MNQQQLHALLERIDWERSFDVRTLGRGIDYGERGKVRSVGIGSAPGAFCTLQGEIDGSGGEVYVCQVKILETQGEPHVQGRCSCPVGTDCKHAVALLWRANIRSVQKPAIQSALHPQAPGPQATDPLIAWNAWLTSLAAPQKATAAPGVLRHFGILMRADDEGYLNVKLAWLRPSKNKPDKLVDPKPVEIDFNDTFVPAPAQGWPRKIEAALMLLLRDDFEFSVGRGWIRIQCDWQEQALDTLLAEYPAFYRKGDAPLQRGPDLPTQLYWKDLTDGSQRLAAGVPGDEKATLLHGASLWYVQEESGCFGRVTGDTRLLASIRSAPSIEPEHVDALRQRLHKHHPGPVIPPPNKRAPVETLEVRPQPILRMRSIQLPLLKRGHRRARVDTTLGCAQLVFDYGGHRLAPESLGGLYEPVRQFSHGRVTEIHRDEKAETEIVQYLEFEDLLDAETFAENQGIRRHALQGNDYVLLPDHHRKPADADAWQPLLAMLAHEGYRIEYDRSFAHDQLVDIDDWHADIEPSGNAWFDVSLGIDVGGERIDLLPILRRVLADPSFPRHPVTDEKKNASHRVLIDENRSVAIPLSRLRALIEPVLEWVEGDGDLHMHRSQAPALRELADDSGLIWHSGDALRAQLELLADAKRSSKEPLGFKATLRPYQREGLAWLDFLGKAGLGGILADDMGLGKTVQVLAHIVAARQRGQLQLPVLVVAPTSLVGNWRDETKRFAPHLKVLVLHGPDRADHYPEIADHHLIITTYPLLARDRDRLLEKRFSLLVLDESQAIKNPRSQAARVVREIPATRRLAMTGTPLENHLGELWAQFDAVEPGLLGGHKQFTKLYRTPIEKHGDGERQQRLNRRVGPLLLRRSKAQVLRDLPAKTEIVRTLELEGEQRSLYETLRLAQHARVRQAVKQRGMSQAGIIVLDALLKLRQACCDPRLVKLASAQKIRTSVKLDALLELVDGLVSEGSRILLFSQFTEMLGLIEVALKERGIDYQMLTGQTPGTKRADLVKRFQEGHVPLFLISLKAGGLGLNLTAADTVIHYDPWWNPAVEAQATDRAHRIGQDKPVFVYRLICAGTVEEKIQAMQARKADLARAVLEGGASKRLRFDEADLAELFAPL